MRNMIRLAVAALAAACVLVVPGSALARHGHRHEAEHHRAHHKTHHKARHHARRHARRVRLRHIGVAAGSSSNTSPTPAGTVASFDGTTLVIMLADHSTVSGKVTDATEIECEAMQQQADDDQGDDNGDNARGDDHSGPGRGDDQGDDNGNDQGNDNDQGDDNGSDQGNDNDQGDDNGNDQGDDNDADEQQAPACDTSALTPNTQVESAVLRISSAGSVWKKIEILR